VRFSSQQAMNKSYFSAIRYPKTRVILMAVVEYLYHLILTFVENGAEPR
jgi:hypothetical protein